jgi:tetratricopeptide (TPR) repeat protein
MRLHRVGLLAVLWGIAAPARPQDAAFANETPQHQALGHYKLGQDLMRHEQFQEAIAEFKTATDLEPLWISAYLAMGRAQMALKEYGEAVATFKSCDNAFHRLAASSISGVADPDNAIQKEMFALEGATFQIIARQGGQAGTPESRLEVTKMQNMLDDLKKLSEGLSTGPLPRPAECMLSLGSSYVHLGRYKEAEDALKAAAQGRFKFGEAHNNLAVVYRLQGRTEEALKEVALAEKYHFKVNPDFKRALANPDAPLPPPEGAEPPPADSPETAALHDDTPRLSYRHLGELYRSDPDRAMLELATTPDAQIRYRLDRLRTPAGRKETADTSLALGGLLHTELAFQQIRKGVVEVGHRNLAVARELMDLVADPELSQKVVRTWFLAVAQESQSRLSSLAAEAILRDGLQRFPNDPDMLLAQAAIQEASLVESDDPQPGLRDVERSYRRILEAVPESLEAHLRLGRVLGEEGRLPEAEEALTWARDRARGPRDLYLVHLFLGAVAEQEGHASSAAESYRAALTQEPSGQSALIGLSHSLTLAGDELEGTRLVQDSLVRPEGQAARPDPWWSYRMGLLTHGDEAWASLRRLLSPS